MKTRVVALLGILLCFAIIFIMANYIENGDINSVSMYFVVFLIPSILMAFMNALYIRFIQKKVSNRTLKIIICFIPILVLMILSFMDNLSISFIDGDFSFITILGTIALGITNLIWAISLFKKTSFE